MKWKIYLSGEIHSNWRNELKIESKNAVLNVDYLEPETDHDLSDNTGANILGSEEKKFWHDHKGAKINSIRIRRNIDKADIIVVKFGEKYKQWNAAFDAGYATARGKSLIVIHNDDHQHALKEIDAVALAVVQNNQQLIEVLKYVTKE
ncbi:YtoQ family protein [Paracoccaceae bacterium]|nr:YtoQ family protein [Paracoccaceae bacterium]